jgi:hypothetical protein
MQAIIVDCVLVVQPQLAPIVGDNAEPIMAIPEDSQAASPTHGKVITTGKPWPPATCVAIVHIMLPSGHIWPTIVQIRAPATLAKVEDILSEKTMTISCARGRTPATCTHNSPSITSIGSMVPE